MSNDQSLRRKWTLRAHGQQVVFIKNRGERPAHVYMKAFLWALYLPAYPGLQVEVHIGDRYKPDVVALDQLNQPIFWGEAGQVGAKKIGKLLRRYPQTHFAMAKWERNLEPYQQIIESALGTRSRTVPFDLLRFEEHHIEQYVDQAGNISLTFEDIEFVRLFDE